MQILLCPLCSSRAAWSSPSLPHMPLDSTDGRRSALSDREGSDERRHSLREHRGGSLELGPTFVHEHREEIIRGVQHRIDDVLVEKLERRMGHVVGGGLADDSRRHVHISEEKWPGPAKPLPAAANSRLHRTSGASTPQRPSVMGASVADLAALAALAIEDPEIMKQASSLPASSRHIGGSRKKLDISTIAAMKRIASRM